MARSKRSRRGRKKTSLSYVEALWAESFQRLKEFKAEHGHCDVPATYKNRSLANWVIDQRVYRNRGTLDLQRERKLERLGFDWDPRETRWHAWLGQLRAFRRDHGHTSVPLAYPENPELGKWVQRQRRMYLAGSLLEHRVRILEAMGFLWDLRDAYWEELFGRLKTYRRAHGHCEVPHLWDGDPTLGRWVAQQRRQERAGTLDPGRRRRLAALGFAWDLRDPGERAGWDAMLRRLRAFRTEHGHVRVPFDYAKDPALGRWVTTQRRLRKKGEIERSREKRLEKLGMEWDAWEALWGEMYGRLVAFYRVHGHTRVPQGYEPDPTLGSWVSTQRKRIKSGKMSKEQRSRLAALGFKDRLR